MDPRATRYRSGDRPVPGPSVTVGRDPAEKVDIETAKKMIAEAIKKERGMVQSAMLNEKLEQENRNHNFIAKVEQMIQEMVRRMRS